MVPLSIFLSALVLAGGSPIDEVSSFPCPDNYSSRCVKNVCKCIKDSKYQYLECSPQLDLVFILDSSSSVGFDNYKKILEFCKDFLKTMNIDDGLVRVGMVSFSTTVTVEFQLNSFSTKKDVFDEIDIRPLRQGSTNTADALKVVHRDMFTKENGDRPNVRNIVILITDGVSVINSRRTIHEATKAREKGVHIYAIGIALRDKREVNAIVSIPTEENAFFIDDFDDLKGLEEDILQSICDNGVQ